MFRSGFGQGNSYALHQIDQYLGKEIGGGGAWRAAGKLAVSRREQPPGVGGSWKGGRAAQGKGTPLLNQSSKAPYAGQE